MRKSWDCGLCCDGPTAPLASIDHGLLTPLDCPFCMYLECLGCFCRLQIVWTVLLKNHKSEGGKKPTSHTFRHLRGWNGLVAFGNGKARDIGPNKSKSNS